MRLTVLGGGGATPTPERGCSGYLVDQDGYRLLIDPGYATLPVLLRSVPATAVDAVFVSHSHGDHCADLNPLLRVRHLNPTPTPRLAVFALPGALDAVLALDSDMRLTEQCDVHEIIDTAAIAAGPFTLRPKRLTHFVDNVGVRVEAGGAALAYTGDGGADPQVVDLAREATVLLAEASFAEVVPAKSSDNLASASQVAGYATAAAASALVLTHLLPETDPAAALAAARAAYSGRLELALPGLSMELT